MFDKGKLLGQATHLLNSSMYSQLMPLMVIESRFHWFDMNLLLAIAKAHGQGDTPITHRQVEVVRLVTCSSKYINESEMYSHLL